MADETGDPRIVTRPEKNAATSFRDHASGPPSEAPDFTDRPNDLTPKDVDVRYAPVLANSTMAERAKEREKAAKKQQKSDDSEDKAVSSSATKARRATKK